jgi:hypothetical protein
VDREPRFAIRNFESFTGSLAPSLPKHSRIESYTPARLSGAMAGVDNVVQPGQAHLHIFQPA